MTTRPAKRVGKSTKDTSLRLRQPYETLASKLCDCRPPLLHFLNESWDVLTSNQLPHLHPHCHRARLRISDNMEQRRQRDWLTQPAAGEIESRVADESAGNQNMTSRTPQP